LFEQSTGLGQIGQHIALADHLNHRYRHGALLESYAAMLLHRLAECLFKKDLKKPCRR
jgi:hypothetical protein